MVVAKSDISASLSLTGGICCARAADCPLLNMPLDRCAVGAAPPVRARRAVMTRRTMTIDIHHEVNNVGITIVKMRNSSLSKRWTAR